VLVQLPGLILELLPPIYIGLSRVLERLQIRPEEMYGLFLLRNSHATNDTLMITEFLDSLAAGMGYASPAEANEVLTKLTGQGFTRCAVPEEIALTPAGVARLDELRGALRRPVEEFLRDQTPPVAESLHLLFDHVCEHPSLVPLIVRAFMRKPPATAANLTRTQDRDHLNRAH